MHPADIQAAIKKAGSSQAEIARALGVTRGAVSFVVAGHSTSERIATEIATITGIHIDRLWPGRYTEKRAAA
ncbi:MAG TPA: helix-turn-helix domain-containing protein [Thermoguttaceae bacterium]